MRSSIPVAAGRLAPPWRWPAASLLPGRRPSWSWRGPVRGTPWDTTRPPGVAADHVPRPDSHAAALHDYVDRPRSLVRSGRRMGARRERRQLRLVETVEVHGRRRRRRGRRSRGRSAPSGDVADHRRVQPAAAVDDQHVAGPYPGPPPSARTRCRPAWSTRSPPGRTTERPRPGDAAAGPRPRRDRRSRRSAWWRTPAARSPATYPGVQRPRGSSTARDGTCSPVSPREMAVTPVPARGPASLLLPCRSGDPSSGVS